MECTVLSANTAAGKSLRNSLIQSIRRRLLGQGVTVKAHTTGSAPQWRHSVVVVRITEDALHDEEVLRTVRGLYRRVTIIPVMDKSIVESKLPAKWRMLDSVNRLRHAEWEPLIKGIRIGLGLEPRPDTHQVFVSYHRKDGSEVANTVREMLLQKDYNVFLDTESLYAGAMWMDELMRALQNINYILLICSPTVLQSKYVAEELRQARARGMPIRAIVVDDAKVPPMVGQPPTLSWSWSSYRWRRRKFAARVCSFVGKAIADRHRFREKTGWMVEHLIEDYELEEPTPLGDTRGDAPAALLAHGERSLIVVWDEGEPSADALHGAELIRARSTAPDAPVLVCFGDYFAPMVYLEAAEWVANRVGFEICPLIELELHVRTALGLE